MRNLQKTPSMRAASSPIPPPSPVSPVYDSSETDNSNSTKEKFREKEKKSGREHGSDSEGENLPFLVKIQVSPRNAPSGTMPMMNTPLMWGDVKNHRLPASSNISNKSGGGSVVNSNDATKINTDDSGIGKFSARSSSEYESTGSRSATTADSDDTDEETDTSESQETSEERAIRRVNMAFQEAAGEPRQNELFAELEVVLGRMRGALQMLKNSKDILNCAYQTIGMSDRVCYLLTKRKTFLRLRQQLYPLLSPLEPANFLHLDDNSSDNHPMGELFGIIKENNKRY